MTPHKQLYLHNPKIGMYGDCYRTAIGCILNLPPQEVPHFYDGIDSDGDATEANKARDYWLAGRGYGLFTTAYDCELDHALMVMKHNARGMHYLLAGKSRTGVNHVVVCLGDQIVWDPSQTDSGIIGRASDGYLWVEMIVPLKY